jgi:hypothetical protein
LIDNSPENIRPGQIKREWLQRDTCRPLSLWKGLEFGRSEYEKELV